MASYGSTTADTSAPAVSEAFIRNTLKRLYGLSFDKYEQLAGYDDKNYRLINVKQEDENLFITDVNILKHGCVFKITNPLEAFTRELSDAQTKLMVHANKHGVMCQTVIPQKQGTLTSWEVIENSGHTLPVRLLTFLPGTMLRNETVTELILVQLGEMIAQWTVAVKDFHHNVYDTYGHSWSHTSINVVNKLTSHFDDKDKEKLINGIMDEFQTRFHSVQDKLQCGMIHSDFNEGNLLIDKTRDPVTLCGLLDLNDAYYGPRMFDWTTAILYMMLEAGHGSEVKPIEVGAHVLKGYMTNKEAPAITMVELQLARIAMLQRVAMSVTYGWYSYKQQPQNGEYILHTQKMGWNIIDILMNITDDELIEAWHMQHVK